MAAENEYQVVARRYRPQNFSELIGQQHIAQALANAIQNNRIGHAYLFTGARGVGKTSSARIFAKSLNCIHGPTVTPCNQCEICEGIAQGEDIDVLEIDGASNRGIDQIRTLIQNVSVRPVRARFKIYIIDEVHMLTNEAFNALLKTLEEPPEHVKFIFCTTEVNKIPITILSRCQRFDFAGIRTSEIAERLQAIVSNEGLSAEPEAIALLARRANGSMRDGQSLLEQLLAYTSGTITLRDVHQLLGTAGNDVLTAIIRSISRHAPAEILRTLDVMIQQGTDPGLILEQIFGCLRDMMALLAGCGGESFLFLPSEMENEAREMAQSLGLDLILAAMQIIDHTLARMKVSTQGRLLVEMAFVRLCELQNFTNLGAFVEKMEAKAVFPDPSASTQPALPASFTPASAPAQTSASQASPAQTSVSQTSPARRSPEVSAPANAQDFQDIPEKQPLSPPPEVCRSFVEEMTQAPGERMQKSEDTPPFSVKTPPAAEFQPVPEVKPVPQTQSLPEVKPAPLTQTVPEVKPVPQTQSLPEVKPAPLTQSLPEVKPAPQTQSLPEVKSVLRWNGDEDSSEIPDDIFAIQHGNTSQAPPPASVSSENSTRKHLWEAFLAVLDRIPTAPDLLRAIDDIEFQPEMKQLIVTYPFRCEFALGQFQKNASEVQMLERETASALNLPGLHVKFRIPAHVPVTQKDGGLRTLYSNPLVHAAEELFGGIIGKIETYEKH